MRACTHARPAAFIGNPPVPSLPVPPVPGREQAFPRGGWNVPKKDSWLFSPAPRETLNHLTSASFV
ncbi:rCG21609 [Rattus norvegicus]|uniref:RCG21609 n=1 Tax=Rattus norvegicus TaxID=10116 RepID=A6J172_RAT|nr:rCG21609 [Rattus norvegicus]